MNKRIIILFFVLELISTSLFSQNNEYFNITMNKNMVIFNDSSSNLFGIHPLDYANNIVDFNKVDFNFINERYILEKEIFSKNELLTLKKFRPFVQLLINTKNNEIASLSFAFNATTEDIGVIDQQKLYCYRQKLMENFEIKKISFNKKIAKDGYIRLSFRVFMNTCQKN